MAERQLKNPMNYCSTAYERLVLKHPAAVLFVLFCILAFFTYHARSFSLDASADSLLLEDDNDLKLYRKVIERYGVSEFLVVTYTPVEDLFSDRSLKRLQKLRDRFVSLDSVESVVSLLDVPLLKSSGLSDDEISADSIKTLGSGRVSVEDARSELCSSPIYSDYVVSSDGQTTGILINLATDDELERLAGKRSTLLEKKRSGSIDRKELNELQNCSRAYEERYNDYKERRHQDIQMIRSIIEPFKEHAQVYLGGVPMIADDMITFIRKDLVVFGIGVFIFIVVTLTIIFRELRWVVLPLLCCFYAVLLMIGILGFCSWEVTVISSNFISLMLILTMSMNIHIAVRYLQLCRESGDAPQNEIVSTTMKKMVWPCLYTALTTILAFCSLIFSDIRPVIDFGWMMTIGLAVTFCTSFILLPALLVMLRKSVSSSARAGQSIITAAMARAAQQHGGTVLAGTVVFVVLSAAGIANLRVENSFIKYFSSETEIYQGLKLIDDKLGGTMLLDVILDFGDAAGDAPAAGDDSADDWLADDDLDWASDGDDQDAYWFTPYKINKIKTAHDFLDGLPEVGKVLSLASMVRVAEDFLGKELDGIELGVLYKKLPDSIKSDVIDPYVSVDNNEARITLRVLDSNEELRRKELLEKIESGLKKRLAFDHSGIRIAGLLVLYNNMLQSLFRSQILTLGIVLAGIGVMLLVLFRSFSLAIIGIVPNLFAVGVVLGIMGLLDIPLDMMTITIAAITMGIAIDNSIHYIYRYREEYARCGDYVQTMRVCHGNVGRAILNTSITIVFGFSILVLSNFIPTIYFGIFTGLAMMIALVSVLIVLPKLLLMWKPFPSGSVYIRRD